MNTGLGSVEVTSDHDKRTFLAGGSLWGADGNQMDWTGLRRRGVGVGVLRCSSSSCAVKGRHTAKRADGVSFSKDTGHV